MRFLNPLGFLALLGIPVIILLYLLKQKYKEQEVSSLFLWKKAQMQSLAQEPWQKLKKNILMFLQLLAVALLAISLSNPYVMGGMQTSHTVFGLDCSLSMQAKDGENGKSRLEQAKQEIKNKIEQAPADAVFSIVLLQDNPVIVLSNATDKKTILQELEKAEATNGGVNWQNAKELLELAAENNGNIIVFTDQKQSELEDVQTVILGKNSENTAITLLSHSQGEDGWQALVKVSHFGGQTITKTVNLFCNGEAFDRKEITLAPGESKDVIFTSIPQQTVSMTATLTPEDVLSADDRAFDGAFLQSKKKVLLVTEQNIFLEKVYSLLPEVELYKTDTDNIEQLSGYSLYIFDGVLPEALPDDGFLLLWNPPKNNNILSLETEKQFLTPAKADSYNNIILTEELEFDIAKANTIITPLWTAPILEVEGNTIAVAGEKDGKKVAVFSFDIHNTDLPLQKEFPILIYQLQNWFFPQGGQILQTVQSGDAMEISLLPETKEAWIVLPDGKQEQIAPPFPPSLFTTTQKTGIYTMVQKNDTKQETKTTFAVNAKTAGESDLTAEDKTVTEGMSEKTFIKTAKSFQNYIILALLVLLLIEWRVNCREH